MSLENLPKEIILLILTLLDPKSIFQFSLACKRIHEIANSVEEFKKFKIDFNSPDNQPIIEAAEIKKDLLNGKLNGGLFFAIFKKNPAQLASLFKKDKTIKLFYPCYNDPNIRRDEIHFSPTITYTLFLNQESSKKRISNFSSIHHFHVIEPSIHEVDLSKVNEGVVSYQPTTPQECHTAVPKKR